MTASIPRRSVEDDQRARTARDARTDPVPAWGLGSAPIGDLPDGAAQDIASRTVSAALERGVAYFDTAPHYGSGRAESRLGRALAGVKRDSYAISTKVGRTILDADGIASPNAQYGARTVKDINPDALIRSFEGSLERLGVDFVDLVMLHDPVEVDESLKTAIPFLRRLRDQGLARAIGIGMNFSRPLARFCAEAELDAVMVAGRLTLLDQEAATELLPTAQSRGCAVIAAGVYNSGVLADPDGRPSFNYAPASAEVLERARRMRSACERYGVSLAAAAVNYPTRYAGVASVVVGARSAPEVEGFADACATVIPADLWDELDAL